MWGNIVKSVKKNPQRGEHCMVCEDESFSVEEHCKALGRNCNFFLPVKYFTDRSKVVLLLWIFLCFFLSCVC